MSSNTMSSPWLEDVYGEEVPAFIEADGPVIRVEAGPGTGKTFGLVRRVQRIMHPDGLNVAGEKVLVVAFNRVIAKELRRAIDQQISDSPHSGEPTIQTVHALCLKVMGSDLRLLLPHEREAMLYDVRCMREELKQTIGSHKKCDQALRDHEADIETYDELWATVEKWLIRHKAQLISQLPRTLFERLYAGDFVDQKYRHVIVDEYQDLTPGEQRLFMELTESDGNFVALGDPRQSIYKFRGNDIDGLVNLEALFGSTGKQILDFSIAECRRCPPEIVNAANKLMVLEGAKKMEPASQISANTHVVVWNSLKEEAEGMAAAIVNNIRANPQSDSNGGLGHLAMVTRRAFGYQLRDEIQKLDSEITVDISFSESLLESWSVREAFLFFCLLVDPDAPTWRAWFSYRDPVDGKSFRATERNADAYLKFLDACNDQIIQEEVMACADRPSKPGGVGGVVIWERAKRFRDLLAQWSGVDGQNLITQLFDMTKWSDTDEIDTAGADMMLLREKALEIYKDLTTDGDISQPNTLKQIARQLRYQIATREPFVTDNIPDLEITTLWGAKGLTAYHVYIIGLSNEAIPGKRRDEYPGTDEEHFDEQKRLFYVSITRSKKTLVLSRARWIPNTKAKRLGLPMKFSSDNISQTERCTFLSSIRSCLPKAKEGKDWSGCV